MCQLRHQCYIALSMLYCIIGVLDPIRYLVITYSNIHWSGVWCFQCDDLFLCFQILYNNCSQNYSTLIFTWLTCWFINYESYNSYIDSKQSIEFQNSIILWLIYFIVVLWHIFLDSEIINILVTVLYILVTVLYIVSRVISLN